MKPMKPTSPICEGCGKRKAKFYCPAWSSHFCYECCTDFDCPAFPIKQKKTALKEVDKEISGQFDYYGKKKSIKELIRMTNRENFKIGLKLGLLIYIPLIIGMITSITVGVEDITAILIIAGGYGVISIRYGKKAIKEAKLLRRYNRMPKELKKKMKDYLKAEDTKIWKFWKWI